MVVLLVVTMVAFAAVSTSAYSGTITFEIPDDNWLKANKKAYAHYWNNETGDGPAWQTKDEQMNMEKAESDKIATFELPEGNWDLIIISGDSGWQTYDAVMNANCVGDTIYVTGEKVENPVDSKKQAIVAAWKNNTDLGPHKVIGSLGTVIGTAFLPGETNQTMYDKFVNDYGPGGQYDWANDGAVETGKSFDEICKEIKKELGLEEEKPSSKDDVSSKGSSNASSKTSSKDSSSKKDSGATETGQDTTIFIVLGVILVAAVGVIIVTRKKKVTE